MFTFWGESNDECFLLRFSIALRKKVHKDIKDFHSNNDFFRTIIYSYLFTLCMHESGCPNFDSFQYWVCIQDWPKLLKGVENKYLCPLLVYLLRRQNKTAVADEVDATVTAQQEDWPNIRTRG